MLETGVGTIFFPILHLWQLPQIQIAIESNFPSLAAIA